MTENTYEYGYMYVVMYPIPKYIHHAYENIYEYICTRIYHVYICVYTYTYTCVYIHI